jgi:hypothetical protein
VRFSAYALRPYNARAIPPVDAALRNARQTARSYWRMHCVGRAIRVGPPRSPGGALKSRALLWARILKLASSCIPGHEPGRFNCSSTPAESAQSFPASAYPPIPPPIPPPIHPSPTCRAMSFARAGISRRPRASMAAMRSGARCSRDWGLLPPRDFCRKAGFGGIAWLVLGPCGRVRFEAYVRNAACADLRGQAQPAGAVVALRGPFLQS